MQTATFTIEPEPPYDFDLTIGYLTHFRDRYATDVFEKGVFRRLLDLDGQPALISVRFTGTLESPRLEVKLKGHDLNDTSVGKARQLAKRMLTGDGLAPFYDMALKDTHLPSLVRGMRGLHITRTVSVFEALVLSILGQQISVHVANMLRSLIIETYGTSVEVDGETLYIFPRPEALVDAGVDGLRGIKFSLRKAEYIVDIAARVVSGELDLEILRGLPSDEVVRRLTGIRGVGPWTAHWLLARALGHPDGFPYGDLALQRHMGKLVNGDSPMKPQEALEYSERWSPYRSYVTTYLFAAARSGRLDHLIKNSD